MYLLTQRNVEIFDGWSNQLGRQKVKEFSGFRSRQAVLFWFLSDFGLWGVIPITDCWEGHKLYLGVFVAYFNGGWVVAQLITSLPILLRIRNQRLTLNTYLLLDNLIESLVLFFKLCNFLFPFHDSFLQYINLP